MLSRETVSSSMFISPMDLDVKSTLPPIFRVQFSSRFGVIPHCFVPCESRREQLPGRMARILILMFFSMASLHHGLLPLRLLTARTNFEEQKNLMPETTTHRQVQMP